MKESWIAFLLLGVIATCFGAPPLIVKADPAWRFQDDGTLLFRYEDGGKQFAFYGALAASSKDRPVAGAFFILPAELLDAKVAFPIEKQADKGMERAAVTTLIVPNAEIDIPDARIYRVSRSERGFLVRAVSDLIPPNITRLEILRMLSKVVGRDVREEPTPPQRNTLDHT